jgi:RNA polymerase subunit RPABC4/transcription elongation factor Spt4
MPEDSNFCPNCGKGISVSVCEQCGAVVPEGSRLCPTCEGKEAARKALESAQLARKQAEERAKQERETARKAREAALLAKRDAKAQAEEKARQEAETISREKEAARKAKEAILLAQKEAEKRAKQERTKAQASPGIRKNRIRSKWLAAGIFLIFILAGVIWVFASGHSAPNQESPSAVVTTTPSINTTATTGNSTPLATTETTAETAMLPTTTETTSSETTTEVITPAPEPTISEVLVRTAAIASVKYDTQVTKSGTPTATMRIWENNAHIRIETIEDGQNVVILIDNEAQTVYRYVLAQNSAERMPYPTPARTAMQAVQGLAASNPAVINTSNIDGKDCLVVLSVVGGTQLKIWLWEDYGFPLRIEETISGELNVVDYSNIDFTDIPDNAFELPSGVKMITPLPPTPPS